MLIPQFFKQFINSFYLFRVGLVSKCFYILHNSYYHFPFPKKIKQKMYFFFFFKLRNLPCPNPQLSMETKTLRCWPSHNNQHDKFRVSQITWFKSRIMYHLLGLFTLLMFTLINWITLKKKKKKQEMYLNNILTKNWFLKIILIILWIKFYWKTQI